LAFHRNDRGNDKGVKLLSTKDEKETNNPGEKAFKGRISKKEELCYPLGAERKVVGGGKWSNPVKGQEFELKQTVFGGCTVEVCGKTIGKENDQFKRKVLGKNPSTNNCVEMKLVKMTFREAGDGRGGGGKVTCEMDNS